MLQAVNFFSFDMYRKTFTRLGGGAFCNEARLTAGALAGIVQLQHHHILPEHRLQALNAPAIAHRDTWGLAHLVSSYIPSAPFKS